MQWVVTTGRTVADARARALDALGIDESDLEAEVLSEPRTTWFGLRTTEATIRARVRPTRPRPKVDRRDGAPPAPPASEPSDGPEPAPEPAAPAASTEAPPSRSPDPTPRGRTAETRSNEPAPPAGAGGAPMSDIPLETQEPTALDFVRGLVDAFGAEADVSAHDDPDDEAVEIRVEGDDLGLLVGPRGATLAAIAELTRTAVAQQHAGRLEGRLRVDVGGYRARRKEALVRFVAQIADKVLDTGEPVAMEPMSPADRKIVHDAVNEIEGVRTISRGEDRRRHVVIQPDD